MTVAQEAAGVAAFSPDGRLLLGRHAHDGRWATIGGSVETGETHLEAAQREAREEVGLFLVTLEVMGRFAGLPIYDVTYLNGTVVGYAVEMFATVLDEDTEARADGREILAVAWANRDDVAALDLAADMAEIVPAAFAWFDSRRARTAQ